MVFFADPDHLGAIFAQPDATTVRPVRSDTAAGEVVVTSHVVEEEVLFAQLVRFAVRNLLAVARRETEVGTLEGKVLEDLLHGELELDSLVPAHRAREIPSVDVSCHTRAHGHIVELRIDLREEVLSDRDVPVVLLLGVAHDLVVLADDRFEVETETLVVLGTCGVDTNAGVFVAEAAQQHVEQAVLIFRRQRACPSEGLA